MDEPRDEASAIVFDVVVTLADRTAFNRHVLRRRIARGELTRLAAAGCAAAPVVAFVFVPLAKAALAGTACDLDDAFDSQADCGFSCRRRRAWPSWRF